MVPHGYYTGPMLMKATEGKTMKNAVSKIPAKKAVKPAADLVRYQASNGSGGKYTITVNKATGSVVASNQLGVILCNSTFTNYGTNNADRAKRVAVAARFGLTALNTESYLIWSKV